MVHKINMKLRKHYYNFFIILETLKKKDIYLFTAPSKKVSANLNQGIVKLQQVQEIMFSKYYANDLKKECLRRLMAYSKNTKAFQVIKKNINKKIISISFQQIIAFANSDEKIR
jgi:hypothetical protein